jgi:hypothetical protein
MTTEKDIWLADAKHQLTLLLEFEDHVLIPDAKTLNTFLLKPTLILKMMYKDHPNMLSEALIKYQDMAASKTISPNISQEDINALEEAFVKGLTPNQAAIEQVKWCDTPEEAGKYLVSQQANVTPLIMLIGLIVGLVAITITFYGFARDKLNIQHESEHLSTLYKNITNVYNQKGTLKLDNATAIKEGLIPETMMITDQKIKNSWDGEVLITGTSSNAFEVKYTHVEDDISCINLVKKEQKIGWNSVIIANKKLDNYKEIKNVDIAEACNSNGFVDITFKK